MPPKRVRMVEFKQPEEKKPKAAPKKEMDYYFWLSLLPDKKHMVSDEYENVRFDTPSRRVYLGNELVSFNSKRWFEIYNVYVERCTHCKRIEYFELEGSIKTKKCECGKMFGTSIYAHHKKRPVVRREIKETDKKKEEEEEEDGIEID